MVFAVIDTNVLVSSLLSKHQDSATVVLLGYLLDGVITPLYNDEILQEYREVLHRPKFNIPSPKAEAILKAVEHLGMALERTKAEEIFPDAKDIVFYEVTLSKDGAYLVTGNTKHFPKSSRVVTPSEMLEILHSQGTPLPNPRASE